MLVRDLMTRRRSVASTRLGTTVREYSVPLRRLVVEDDLAEKRMGCEVGNVGNVDRVH